jgi:hypothetical protein
MVGEESDYDSHQELVALAGLYAKLYRLHRHPLESVGSRRNLSKSVPLK